MKYAIRWTQLQPEASRLSKFEILLLTIAIVLVLLGNPASF